METTTMGPWWTYEVWPLRQSVRPLARLTWSKNVVPVARRSFWPRRVTLAALCDHIHRGSMCGILHGGGEDGRAGEKKDAGKVYETRRQYMLSFPDEYPPVFPILSIFKKVAPKSSPNLLRIKRSRKLKIQLLPSRETRVGALL